MNAKQFPDELRKKAAKLRRYAKVEFPRMAGKKVKRFIDGNFRAQGWQGRSFLPWQKNKKGTTILIRKGRLRRSIHVEIMPGRVRVYTDSPYARIHNRGGIIHHKSREVVLSYRSVKRIDYEVNGQRVLRLSKTRTESQQRRISEIRRGTIPAYNVTMPKRQFMPEKAEDSPILINSIKRSVVKSIKEIFN